MILNRDQRDDTSKFADSGVDDQVGEQYLCGPTINIDKFNGQIIIHVPFTQNVRVRSILLKLGE